MSETEAKEAGQLPVIPGLCEFAAQVTSQRLERMLSHVDGVRHGNSTEAVHQMRVWSRRSRAALEMFRVCFSGRNFAEVEREVKAATDALGEARDLDVMIENLQKRADKLPASRRGGVVSFIEDLRKRREQLQGDVTTAVTELESRNLAHRFKELTTKDPEKPQHKTRKSRGPVKRRRHNG